MTLTATNPTNANATAFIDGVLRAIGAPVDAITSQAFTLWLENEQGPGLSGFDQNKGNPLGIQTPEAQASGKSGNVNTAIQLTAAELINDYRSIVGAFRKGASVNDIATQIVDSRWNTGQTGGVGYGGLQTFLNPGSAGSSANSVNMPPTVPIPPEAGVDIKNFHGYDLSAIPSDLLGNAEQVIQKYIIDPGYKAQIDQKLSQNYGYSSDWWSKIPQVNAIMIYAAVEWDPTSAAGKNEFLGALRNTTWWQQNNANQRAWDQANGANGAPGSDPAQAHQALADAQEKVLADANQIGVSLTKQELDQIANIYAANTFVQSGSIGTQSGTATEWLDQAIINTILNVQGQKVGNLPTDFASLPTGQSPFTQQTQGGTTPGGLFGISGQLYNQFVAIAQQYLMYNPTNPGSSLINNQYILNAVSQALQNYTGSGSSFGSSNLMAGAEAAFTADMKERASQIYPSLAASINQGIATPQNYVQPYASLISSMTGINANSIDFTSPQWNWVINSPQPGSNVKQALSLDQLQQKLVTMPQWQTSNNAAQMGTDITTALNKQFGFGGN